MAKDEPLWQQSPHSATDQSNTDLDYLFHRIEKLTLINRALWEIIKSHHGCRDDELVAKVAEIDLRDGQLDDTYQLPAISCPQCGKKINARHDHCLYCGFDDLPKDVFTSVR